MKEDAGASARKLAGMDNFALQPGMLLTSGARVVRKHGDPVVYPLCAVMPDGRPVPVRSTDLPDLEDGPTRGALQTMLSGRVGGYVWLEPRPSRHPAVWDVCAVLPSGTRRLIATGGSWAEAFLAAWELTP